MWQMMFVVFLLLSCLLRRINMNIFFRGDVHPEGLWPPNSKSVEICVQCTYPQVSSSYIYSFGSYHVDKHTNKQTKKQTNKQTNKQRPLKTSNALRYATTLGRPNRPKRVYNFGAIYITRVTNGSGLQAYYSSWGPHAMHADNVALAICDLS